MDINIEPQKSYYAIIPANVRYDRNLTANAKLLYGEITALCNEKGYCWAKNEYFAELYGTSEKTITRWINDLKENSYIGTKIDVFRYQDGTVKKVRYIFIDKNVCNQREDIEESHTDKNVLNHEDKNITYNNTSFNNTLNNTTNKKVSKKESFDDLIDNYTLNDELRTELKNHLATRKSKKATLTNRAIELSFKKLDELTKGVPINEQEEMKIKIVQQSIERGWTGFFAISNYKQNKRVNNNGWDYLDEEFNQIKQNNVF